MNSRQRSPYTPRYNACTEIQHIFLTFEVGAKHLSILSLLTPGEHAVRTEEQSYQEIQLPGNIQ